MEILLNGIGVGLAVAAPVGPIGLLCIRRTLNNGGITGLASGLGAATADATYGLLVATGFAATNILMNFAEPLAIAGGLLIALLGLMSIAKFVKERAGNRNAPKLNANGAILPAFTTTYLLTLSNPMTILIFTGFIAALGGTAKHEPTAVYWLVLGVFFGSTLWWLFLVQVTRMAKSRITDRVTRWFDLVSGLALFIWGGWVLLGALGRLSIL